MYNTNRDQNGYCLLYYVNDKIFDIMTPSMIPHQIIPYCLQISEEIILLRKGNVDSTVYSNFTFGQLQEKNISSKQLLSWSAPIDLAERYEMFLNNISYSSSSSSNNETLFYNCTLFQFGPFCRFTFLNNKSFNEIVASHFQSKNTIETYAKVTCYKHLNCSTSRVCLDWREICDRKIDCLDCHDGSDEFNCWQLEINGCAKNEYRCHNGQCIPLEFLQDVSDNADCLDRTDEIAFVYDYAYVTYCSTDPTFRCEEHTCRLGRREYPCGDGQCEIETNSNCKNGRGNILIDDLCSKIMICLMKPDDEFNNNGVNEFCNEITCTRDKCPSQYEFPLGPILFGHVRFIFSNEDEQNYSDAIPLPDYVCYNEKLCKDFLPFTVSLNDSTCRHFHELGLNNFLYDHLSTLITDVKDLFRACSIVPNETQYSAYLNMYQCQNSTKFISKHRLVDGIRDCPFDDDETFNQSCSLNDVHYRFSCSVDGSRKCFAPLIIENNIKDCDEGEDERGKIQKLQNTHVYFQRICDRIDELSPILIDGQYETDETECEHWQCNNTYTRCDGIWSCRNGADEVNCPSSPCPDLHHSCVFLNDTSRLSCLPLAQADDGNIDCLGGSDERDYCRTNYQIFIMYHFRCLNDSECIPSPSLCDTIEDCPLSDDEEFCTNHEFYIPTICSWQSSVQIDVNSFLYHSFCAIMPLRRIYFMLNNMATYSVQLIANTTASKLSTQTKIRSVRQDPVVNTTDITKWYCNRGIPIYIRLDDNTHKLYCLCPPSYYGNTCQYQNQRVSLTIQIRATSDWRSVFTFITTLIDDEGNIESHDYIDYLPIRDCTTKYNIYLLYLTRPKNTSKNYSIKIDAFNKVTLNYRSSWIFPVQFPFLPVYRLSVLLTIPVSSSEPIKKCSPPCIHGQCFNYINNQHKTFCRCEHGWSGLQCTRNHTCDCAINSSCISDTICVCPIDKYGPRCYLHQSSCDLDTCANGGQCVPNDEHHMHVSQNKSTCICSPGYYGNRCEHRLIQTRIDISFYKSLAIPSSLFIHLITVQSEAEPIRTSIMKKIAFDQSSLLVHTSTTFNIAFVAMSNEYYLLILREKGITAANISTQIIPSRRCLSIEELFNNTFANQHLIKRIKHYHIPCQKRLELVCFYDNIHLCLCDLNRRANCFEFDHNMTYNCYGLNICENGGECFQDDPKCPTSSICACQECYYGSRCQFSTKGSTFSLDVILGYQIHPNVGISRQPVVVKVAIVLTTTMLGLGFLNSLFSLMTFQRKITHDVGCGLYLLTSSITSLITMNIFIIKFWFLIASQMGSIRNRLLIQIQCVLIDFFIRFLVSTGDWLSVCVAIERAMNVWKGVHFNKNKSKQIAKWIILIVFVCNISSYIHDPIHRRLVDDEEEHRTWCITKYSPSLLIYDWSVNIFHFSIPFAINCISTLIIIFVTARHRSIVKKNQSYKKLLREQLQHHKHLIISPFILILMALPRFVISFLSGCMKSARNPWFYLIGYFISFIPLMLIFVVFVLPSKMYMKVFTVSIKRFRRR